VFENLNALQAMAFVMEQWDGQRGHGPQTFGGP